MILLYKSNNITQLPVLQSLPSKGSYFTDFFSSLFFDDLLRISLINSSLSSSSSYGNTIIKSLSCILKEVCKQKRLKIENKRQIQSHRFYIIIFFIRFFSRRCRFYFIGIAIIIMTCQLQIR